MKKPNQPKLTISQMLFDGRLSHPEIAAIVGVSARTVTRVAKEIKTEEQENPGAMRAYQRQLSEQMDSRARARRYRELAKQKKQPMVALKALERIDDLTGITTARDRLKITQPVEPQQQGPMFLLGPGARVEVHAPRREKVINPQKSAGETKPVPNLGRLTE